MQLRTNFLLAGIDIRHFIKSRYKNCANFGPVRELVSRCEINKIQRLMGLGLTDSTGTPPTQGSWLEVRNCLI